MRPSLLRPALSFAALLFVAALGIGIYRAGLDATPPPQSGSQIVFHGGSVQGQRIRTRSWSASYDKVISNADQSVLDVEGIHDGIIYSRGKPFLRVRAAHMTVDTLTHDFTMLGPIRVETVSRSPRRIFTTTSAVWSDAAEKLSLDKRVDIVCSGEPPLAFSRATFDIKTGQLDVHGIEGRIP